MLVLRGVSATALELGVVHRVVGACYGKAETEGEAAVAAAGGDGVGAAAAAVEIIATRASDAEGEYPRTPCEHE